MSRRDFCGSGEEIINGELIVALRPVPDYMTVATILGEEIGPPYRRGRGGPGGWIFLDETEIRLVEDTVVPDLADWRKNTSLVQRGCFVVDEERSVYSGHHPK